MYFTFLIALFLLSHLTVANPVDPLENGHFEIYVRAPKKKVSFLTPASLGTSLNGTGGDFGHVATRVSCINSKGKKVQFTYGVQGDFDTLSRAQRETLVVSEESVGRIAETFGGEMQSRHVVNRYFEECKRPPEKRIGRPSIARYKINPAQCDNLQELNMALRKNRMEKNFSLAAHPFCGLGENSKSQKKQDQTGGVCATMAFSFLQAAVPEGDRAAGIIAKSTREFRVPKRGWLNWGGNKNLSTTIQMTTPQDLHTYLKIYARVHPRKVYDKDSGCTKLKFDISNRVPPSFESLAARCKNGPGQIVKRPKKTYKSMYLTQMAQWAREQWLKTQTNPLDAPRVSQAPGER